MKNIFDVNPHIKALYVFEDGNAFEVSQSGESSAKTHAKNTKLEYKIVEREEEVKEVKPKKEK